MSRLACYYNLQGYRSSKDTEDSSSSEEENYDLFKEAASCDYVNKLYHNVSDVKVVTDGRKRTEKSCEDEENTISSHQLFIAKRLEKRLDLMIQPVDCPVAPQKIHPSKMKGVQLLGDSVYIDEVEEEIVERKRPFINKVSNEDYLIRAKEIAVTCDWVASKTNTRLWCSNRKPKVINMKVTKKLPGDKVECDIVSSINVYKGLI